MITCATYDNLTETGEAFRAQFHLRYKCFIERQTYNVKTYNDKEYDQYDTPAAVYLVYQDRNGRALGASRLTPVKHGCMLEDLWPDMVEQEHLFRTDDVWEGTRFCIDKNIGASLRRKISHELVQAYIEFGLNAGISKIIGIMPRLVLRSVFRSSGVDFDLIGPVKIIDGVSVQAAAMEINPQQMEKVRAVTGIKRDLLFPQSLLKTKAA